MADIHISCSCGWLGKQSQLLVVQPMLGKAQRYCPQCHAVFVEAKPLTDIAAAEQAIRPGTFSNG